MKEGRLKIFMKGEALAPTQEDTFFVSLQVVKSMVWFEDGSEDRGGCNSVVEQLLNIWSKTGT